MLSKVASLAIKSFYNQKITKVSKLKSLIVIIESFEPTVKRLLLRSLLSMCSHTSRFFIVQICVDYKVTFIGIDHEYVREMLETVAEIDCA